MLLTSD